jgi:spore coat protein JB
MENRKQCIELMDKLSEAGFFAHDLKLYLDTHPDDEAALSMFKEACRQEQACREAFESCCYPLTACSAGENGEWDWLDGAWPSERI